MIVVGHRDELQFSPEELFKKHGLNMSLNKMWVEKQRGSYKGLHIYDDGLGE